ncbi:Glycosyltransferase involved in cell wall bisynthesis [Spirosoma endophyticum]|uniref:Glycosyltransferase involved in cell wall bisynthesis n=2 Tax=Spirosoma endophyticum TaxID=662367 RepID=A0A1I1PUS0_9BACT|nr:Glycosyltransferase involved in cell wall bisynthesis [Spirosoma endophyticum]
MRMGGAQVLTIDLLNEMCQFHDVSLVVINGDYDQKLVDHLSKKVSFYCLNRNEGSRNPLPILHLNLLLSRLQPDIIHCHERKMIRLIKYTRARTIYTIHDVTIPTDTFYLYDALVAISNSVAADVRNRSNLPVDVVSNGIPMRNFAKRNSYSTSPESIIRLVQVSRLVHEKKGQDILIQALAKLVHENLETNVSLDFIGDGASKSYLLSLAKSLKVEAFINFCGEQERNQVVKHLASYHILVQPSRFEGFGLTVVEGFAAGLPVIASDIEGPAEIMKHLPAGFLFIPESVDACVDALRHVIAAYRLNQIEILMDETYKIVENQFSIQSTASNYLNVYQRLMVTRRVRSLPSILSSKLRLTP